MRILVSNDDGYFSPGIAILAERLAALGEVMVVAPERDRSAPPIRSRSTVPDGARRRQRLSLRQRHADRCVHLALTGLLGRAARHRGLGHQLRRQHGRRHDLFRHSGRATEGFLFGLPSIAVSLASKAGRHFENRGGRRGAAGGALRPRAVSASRCCSTSTCPTIATGPVGALEVTRLGRRHRAEAVVKMETPRGEAYWIGAAGEAQDSGPGTDFHAVASGRVSVTPLNVDLTFPAQLPLVKTWLAS
jgi:5'-nucleotidase